MQQPIITCPSCKHEIKLTESLAAPLIESIKHEHETQLQKKEQEFKKREDLLAEQQKTLAESKATIDEQVAEKVKIQRAMIAEEEAKKAKQLLSDDLDEKAKQISDLNEVLQAKDQKIAEAQRAQVEIARKERELTEAKLQMDLDIEKRLQEERSKIEEQFKSQRAAIIQEEALKAKQLFSTDLETKAKQVADLNEVLRAKEEKLLEAQKAQLEFLRKERELENEKREMEITIEKKLQESQAALLAQAKQEASNELGLKVQEKELTIQGMQKQIEELRRRAEQGSQQLQGEVQELELESMLSSNFPHDVITPVAKGEFGGDALQHVNTPYGQGCGQILWESKRTKTWSDGWLAKLRDDQRNAKAEVAIIVTHALPKDIETFGQIDGIWVTAPRYAIPLAITLRHTLMEVTTVRKIGEGQQTKMEILYQYLTGPRFRHRVEAIVEKFTDMQEDLIKERKTMTKLWARREEQIRGVIESTAGMYGDMQGIAGRALGEISGLELDAQKIEPYEDGSKSTKSNMLNLLDTNLISNS